MDFLELLSELRFGSKHEEAKNLAERLMREVTYQNVSIFNTLKANPVYLLKPHVEYYKNILKEMTMISFYTDDDKTKGQLYYDILWGVFNEKYTDNMEFYIKPLEFDNIFSLGDNVPSIQMKKERGGNVPRFPHNPSVIRFSTEGPDEYYMVNIRLVNAFGLMNNFAEFPTDGIIRTDNVLVLAKRGENGALEYVKSFETKETRECVKVDENSQYRGIEDVRLYWNPDGILCFTAHIPNDRDHRSYASGYYPGIEKGNLSILFSEDEVMYYNLEVWNSVFPTRSEKNILKIEGSESNFIYSTSPLTGCLWPNHDYDAGKRLSLTDFGLSEEEQRIISCDHRGSAGTIEFEGGHLVLFHSHLNRDGQRGYIYRFVLFTANLDKWEIDAYSRWFYIPLSGTQFVTSMERYGENDFIIGFGQNDSIDMYGVIKTAEISKMLKNYGDIPNIKILDFKRDDEMGTTVSRDRTKPNI